MSLHVQRNGKAIGTFDEQTLRALLNAGTLRTTDTFTVPGAAEPKMLATLVGGPKANPWLKGGLLACIIAVALFARFTLTRQKVPGDTVQLIAAAGHRRDSEEELRRGYPILRSRITFTQRGDMPDFPFQKVAKRAAFGRVAVLALDGQDQPLNFGSGFVSEDGSQVITAATLVKGASAVQIWFGPHENVAAANVSVDEETGIGVLVLKTPRVGLVWSTVVASQGDELFVAGNAVQPAPVVATVQSANAEGYKLDGSLPRSYVGSAVMNSAGDACGIVVRPETGAILNAAGIRRWLGRHAAVTVGTLPDSSVHWHSLPVVVDSASIEDGQLVLELRNTGRSPVILTVLRVCYHQLPSDAAETVSLERLLATTAVQVSSLEEEGPTSDEFFRKKQELREVTARLEAQRHAGAQALAEARKRVLRTDMLAIEVALPMDLPQRVTISTEAASAWGAVVTVLDAME